MTGRTSSRCLLAALTAVVACVETRRGSVDVFLDPQRTSLSFEVKDGELMMQINATMVADASADGAIIIDRATVVATVGGEQIVFEDPQVVSEDFPLEGELSSHVVRASFTVPSPITDVDQLESRCAATARSVRLTVDFYSTLLGRGAGSALDSTIKLPLVPANDPLPPDVFGSHAILAIESQGFSIALPRITRGAGDDVFVTIEDTEGSAGAFIAGAYRVFRADPDGVALRHSLHSEFSEMPRTIAGNGGGTVIAGRSAIASGEIGLLRFDESAEWLASSGIRLVAGQQALEYEALRLAYLGPSPTGSYVVVQSAFLLEGPAGPVAPFEDKAYGSFLFEVGDDLSIESATSLDRDLLFIESTPEGHTLLATSPLYPLTEDPTFAIERRDAAGVTVWSYEQPAEVFEAVVRPTEEGGAIAVFEDQSTAGTFDVIAIGPDGSLRYRFTIEGSAPSIAINDAGLAVVTFVGTVPGFDLPTRAVPLLVELSDEGVPLRAAQVACGGAGVVGNDATDGVMFVGTFDERFTIGDTIVPSGGSNFLLSAVE